MIRPLQKSSWDEWAESKSENCPQDASIIEEDPSFRRVSLQKQSFLEGEEEKRATNIDGVNKNLFWRYY